MKAPQHLFTAAALATLTALSPASWAQSNGLADGEVRKVDLAAAKVTLKHGEIKSLNMPPMTMAYRVRSPQLLEGVSVGDRVRFEAERIDGNFTITALAKAP